MRVLALAAVVYCVYCITPGQIFPATVIRSRRVATLEIEQRNMIDALLLFGQQEHIAIGIEYIDEAAFQERLSVRFYDRTLSEVLDALTHPLGYQWSADGQMVMVTHPGALLGKSNLLNTRIPHFKIGEMTMHEANMALRMQLYFVLNPQSRGFAGDDLGGNRDFRAGPFDLKNVTVRQILNRIVSQHSNGAWVVQQPPWTMDKDLGNGTWKVLEYDRPNGEYSRELQVWGLGQHSR